MHPGAARTGKPGGAGFPDRVERPNATQSLRARQPELEHVVWLAEQTSDAVIITDADGVIEYVNPAFEAMTGHARSDALGRTPAILKSGYHDAAFYRALWDQLRAGAEFRGVLINRRKNGEMYHEEKAIRPFVNGTGRITHFISTGRDVSDRVRAMEKLAHAATHDSLTDLPNRTLFFDRLAQALRYATRHAAAFAVAIVDIDRFKAVNDSHGHVVGDALLKSVAQRLRRAVREADTVARLGGDEFGLILLDAGNASSAGRILAKIVRAAAKPFEADGHAVRASVSIGACLYPSHALDESELMKHADEAMYEAKHAGGNSHRLYGEPAR